MTFPPIQPITLEYIHSLPKRPEPNFALLTAAKIQQIFEIYRYAYIGDFQDSMTSEGTTGILTRFDIDPDDTTSLCCIATIVSDGERLELPPPLTWYGLRNTKQRSIYIRRVYKDYGKSSSGISWNKSVLMKGLLSAGLLEEERVPKGCTFFISSLRRLRGSRPFYLPMLKAPAGLWYA